MGEDFAQFMDSGALLWIGLGVLAVWFVYVMLVTVHELGHAIAGLLLTKDVVRLRVGRSPGVIHGRMGRLYFSWHMNGVRGQDDGGAAIVIEKGPPPRVRLLFALAGPIADLVLALVLFLIYLQLSGVPRVCLGLVIAGSLILNALNLFSWSPGSDGREALAALRDGP